RCDHAEIAAAAFKGPKQIRIFVPIDDEAPPVGKDKFGPSQAIQCQAVACDQWAITASGRRSNHAWHAMPSRHRKEIPRGSGSDDFCCGSAAANGRDLVVDMDVVHHGQVDDKSICSYRTPGNVVSTAMHR